MGRVGVESMRPFLGDFMDGFEFKDNSKEVLNALDDAMLRALTRMGLAAEGYAKELVPTNKDGYGGTLKNSISFKVDPSEKSVYIGTNLEYAPYVELGTGAFAKGGGGRPGWWVYVKDGDSSKGKGSTKTYTFEEAKQVMAILRSKGLDAHMTQGQRPQPFLVPAVRDHKKTYLNILKDELKNG